MNFQIVPVAKFENQLLGERPQRFAYSYIKKKKKNDFKSERHFFVVSSERTRHPDLYLRSSLPREILPNFYS